MAPYDSHIHRRLRRPGASLAAVGALAGFMTLSGVTVIGGTAIGGTACYDSIAFNEFWDRVTP